MKHYEREKEREREGGRERERGGGREREERGRRGGGGERFKFLYYSRAKTQAKVAIDSSNSPWPLTVLANSTRYIQCSMIADMAIMRPTRLILQENTNCSPAHIIVFVIRSKFK